MSPDGTGKIRVLLVSQTMNRGGLEENVLATAEGLDKQRFDVSAAFFVGGDVAARLAALPDVKSVHVATRSRWRRSVALVRLIRELRVDILHNHFCWYGLAAGTIAGVRRVETVHNIYSWFSPWQRIFYALHCLSADRMIGVSSAVKDYACRRFPTVRKKHWEIIHNGVDCARFRRRDAHELRSTLGLAPDHVVAGFSGRLEEEKGVRFLLDVAALVARSHSYVRFVLAGAGSLDAEIRKTCATRNLTNVILTGFREDMSALYSVFDIVVFPSLYEGFPLALLEAMAAGCPVVAFSVGGIAEAVDDGVEGYLAEPGSIRDLAGRVGFLAGDREKRLAMGRAGALRVGTHFTGAGMIAKIEDLYTGLMRERDG